MTFTDNLDSHLTGALYCVGHNCTPDPTDHWLGSLPLGTIVSGESVEVTITATIAADTPQDTTIENTADAQSATTVDPTPGNNSSSVSITVDTEADLSVAKSAPDTAVAGDPSGFDYKLKVTNHGPSDNTGGFTVSDTLAGGLTFQTTGSSAECSASGQDVSCTEPIGLAAGESETFTVHATVDSTLNTGTVLENTASVTSNGTVDPNPANDTSNTTSTSVVEDVELAVTKTFDSNAVTAGGDPQSFTIDVTNNGFSDADGVHVTDSVRPP